MNKIPFEYKTIMPGSKKDGGSKSETYVKSVNPNGKVPALQDGDFVLFESNAIMQYIAEKYKLTQVWPADDIKKRALVAQWMHWHHTSSRETTIGVFAPLVRPDLARSFTPEFLSQKRAVIKVATKTLEDQLSKTPYLTGSTMTLADLCVFQDVGQFSPTGHGLKGYDFTPYPNVVKWMQRMEAQPCYNESWEMVAQLKPVFESAAEATKIQANLWEVVFKF